MMIFALKVMDFVLKVMNFGRLPSLSFERRFERGIAAECGYP